MSNYHPDRWVIVKIHAEGHEPYYRVMASWYGGFGGSNSWKLSSGIEKSFDYGTHYEIDNSSGSVYVCHKKAYGMSGYTSGVFEGFVKDAATQDMTFELVDKDFIPLLEPVGDRPSVLPPPNTMYPPEPLTEQELKDLGF